MNRERVLELCDALESGEYAQTIEVLRSTNKEGQHKYCVLGVMCDVSGLGEWKEGPRCDVYCANGREWSADLPIAVAQWYGFSDQAEADNTLNPTTTALPLLNDLEETTFQDFAAMFRKQLKESL